MIEQIYTYFTLEIIYLWLNIGIIPFWLTLIFFPNSNICKMFITSIFPITLLSIVYGYLTYILFKNDFNFLGNFNLYLGLDELINLFKDSSFLILFWIHFLAVNLFCGGWIVKDYQKYNINKILVFFPLIITYFVGPLGIFTYWFIRIFYAKKISLYD